MQVARPKWSNARKMTTSRSLQCERYSGLQHHVAEQRIQAWRSPAQSPAIMGQGHPFPSCAAPIPWPPTTIWLSFLVRGTVGALINERFEGNGTLRA